MASADPADTFPKLLLKHARERAAHPALREKDLGVWQTWSWSQAADEVRRLAAGLHAEGFSRGQHLAIIGENRPRLYFTMMAVQALGGVPVPMYQDAVAAEMVYVFHNAEIAYAMAEDQEQVDKLLEIRQEHPALAHIYLRRSARTASLHAARPDVLRAVAEAWRRGAGEAARPGRRADRARLARRHRGAVLHLGHDRQAEGRGADARGAHRPARAPARSSRTSRPTKTCSPTCRWRGSARTSSRTRRRW